MNQAQSLISLVLLVYVTASTPIFEFTGLDDYSPGILAKDQQPGEKISFNWQRTEVYEILYVGIPKRNLSPNKEYRVDIDTFTTRYGGRHWRAKQYNHFRKPDMPLTLQIDTSTIIGRENNFLEGEMVSGEIAKRGAIYSSYPVYFYNYGRDTLSIGWDDHSPLTKQALDSLGEWRTIETVFLPFCGTGLDGLSIAPKEIALTSTVIYTGNYKTKVRLEYNGLYSNEIEAKINYNQFNSIFDENGDYQDAYLLAWTMTADEE